MPTIQRASAIPASVRIAGVILAAGEGRRLRPATLTRPKALVPFCGLPLLELAARRLAALRLSGLAVNTWHLAAPMEEACRALARSIAPPVRVSRETTLLGTGGGLRRVAALLSDAEHFLVHNADVILDCDLAALLQLHLERRAAVTAFLVPATGPRTVIMNGGRIIDFSRPGGAGRYTFAGIHVLRRDVLDLLPEETVCSIIPAYQRAIARGLPVLGLSSGDAFWSDLGRPRDYIQAHGEIADVPIHHLAELRSARAEQARRRAELERSGVRCTGALGLGRDLCIAPGAHLHNVVLWDGVRLGKPALYADAIFTGGRVTIPRTVAEDRRPDPADIYLPCGSTGAGPGATVA